VFSLQHSCNQPTQAASRHQRGTPKFLHISDEDFSGVHPRPPVLLWSCYVREFILEPRINRIAAYSKQILLLGRISPRLL
jgi:hypothetical protein